MIEKIQLDSSKSVTANEVSSNVKSMAKVSRETEDASTSMQQAAQELAQLGAELNSAISWFGVDKQRT